MMDKEAVKLKIFTGIQKTESDCWLYKNSSSGSYSKVRWKGKWYSGHRISYFIFKGCLGDKWVCHTCDIRKCINPDHLFLGSPSDNMKDCSRKGRIIRGENNPLSIFTDMQIEEMRLLKQEGFTYERLQRIFNCSLPQLVNVVKNKIRRSYEL